MSKYQMLSESIKEYLAGAYSDTPNEVLAQTMTVIVNNENRQRLSELYNELNEKSGKQRRNLLSRIKTLKKHRIVSVRAVTYYAGVLGLKKSVRHRSLYAQRAVESRWLTNIIISPYRNSPSSEIRKLIPNEPQALLFENKRQMKSMSSAVGRYNSGKGLAEGRYITVKSFANRMIMVLKLNIRSCPSSPENQSSPEERQSSPP